MKKLGLLVMPLMAVSFLASCGPATYTVSLGDTNGVIIDPTTATQGKDYVATISVNTEMVDDGLPDTLNKVTVGKKGLTSSDYTYTVHEDRLSADFTISKANVTGNIEISLSLLTFKIDSEQEYKDAMLMKDVSFMQTEGEEKGLYQEKFSPTVYYCHSSILEEEALYELESYVEHAADDTYWEYEKEDEKWVKDETSSNRFRTPQDFANEHNLTDIVEEYPYSTLKYENGCYTIDFEDEDAKGTYTFQFLDKKLISFDVLTEEMHEYCNLTYEEITPELPVPDPTI